MAHKCDKCGDVIATSDAFVRHWVSCSGGSNRGEGDRAQPTPRGDRETVQQVARRAQSDLAAIQAKRGEGLRIRERVEAKGAEVRGTAARAGVANNSNAITCPECLETFSRKFTLERHLREQHKVKYVKDISNEAPKDPTSQCPHCNLVTLSGNLQRHIKVHCPVVKASKTPQPKVSPVDSNVSTDSLVERTGNHEIIESEVISDEQFLKQLKEFMADENRGNLAESTTGTYIMRLEHYGRYWRKENPNFSFGKLCIFGSKACLDPPSTARWESTLGSAQARSQGLSAFLIMVKFLREQLRLAKDRGLITDQTFGIRQSHLVDARDETRDIHKRVEKLKEREKTEGDARKERLAESDREREIPEAELDRILKAYGVCEYRAEMFNIIGGDLKEALRRNKVTPTQVRDFVFAESLYTAPGGRNDGWYKMKIKELLNPTLLEDGQKVCVEVGRHKTSKNYGAANDMMPVKTYNAIVKYYKEARPLIFANTKNDGEEYVFVQGTEGKWFDRPYSIFEGILKRGSDFEYRITPYAIRKHISTKAQGHSNAQIRENMPRHMNHSVETAKKSYRKKKAVMEDHSKCLDELVDWTPAEDNLATVELDQGDLEADRTRVIRAEKEKVVQENAAKEQRVQDNKSARSSRKPGERFFFSSDDRNIIKRSFLFALDEDGNKKKSITSYPGLKKGQKSDFHRAYDGDKVFREMVDRIMEDEGFEMKEMKTKIMETYRNFYRENPGNSSASTSGAGKGKASKAKTSKGAPSKAKRRRKVEESESEESEESNDSDDLSDDE